MSVAFWMRADYRYFFEGFQRGMLAQLAARLQARNAAGGNGEGDGMPFVVDDNCAVWCNRSSRAGYMLGRTVLISFTDHVEHN